MIGNNDYNENKPLYLQIIDYVEEQLIQDYYKEGERIPSIRELAEKLGVNPNTCVKAYDIMTSDGMIESRRGMGYYLLDGAKDKAYAKKRDELFHKMIPFISSSLKKYRIDKNLFIKALSDCFDKGENKLQK